MPRIPDDVISRCEKLADSVAELVLDFRGALNQDGPVDDALDYIGGAKDDCSEILELLDRFVTIA